MQELIESLGSLSSNPRLGRISEKHRENLQWIWKEGKEGPGFVDWLQTNDPIYWITGLPGSGKSTLMKYIYEDEIETLINGRSVTKAGYFFHELREPREKTFSGFLASILVQLLTWSSDLAYQPVQIYKKIKKKNPRQFQASLWDESSLIKALESVNRSSTVGVAMLFISLQLLVSSG